MSDEITTLKTCLLQMQNANVDLVKQLDDCRRECAELKARLIEGPQRDWGYAIAPLKKPGHDYKWTSSATKIDSKNIEEVLLDDPKPQGEE